jgi:hypothetical protein
VTPRLDNLQAICDAALIAGLSPGLRETIDTALSCGTSARTILARVRQQTGGPRAPGGLTYLAVEAYLRSLPS